MYNIDFTGGTLVTIRLNEQDPEVKDAVRVATGPASSARRPSVLPDVTVESLKVGGEKSGDAVQHPDDRAEDREGQAGRSSTPSARASSASS